MYPRRGRTVKLRCYPWGLMSRSRLAVVGTLLSVGVTLALVSCLRRHTPSASPEASPQQLETVENTSTQAPPPDAPDFLESIDSAAEWDQLGARPDFHMLARSETVKFVIDTAESNRVYFLQSTRWDLHFSFVQQFIDPRVDHARFNISEYRRPERRFLLGSLMHYQDGDHYTLELVAGDTMSGEQIIEVFELIQPRVYFGPQLHFRPISPLHERNIQGLGERLPVLPQGAVNASVQYQPLVLGTAYGVLRIVRGELDPATVRPNEILVTETVPEEIPPVAALVTSQLQAPLAHVAVLSRNRNTPDMGLRGAADLPALRALEGRIVRLSVGPQEYSLIEASREQAEAAWATARPPRGFRPESNLRERRLRDVCGCEMSSAGAKAWQLNNLCEMGGLAIPPGFVIPFSAYAAHLGRALGPSQLLDTLRDDAFLADAGVRARELAALRGSILRAPVDPRLLAQVQARLRRLANGQRFIFRSSTNAEDLPGFNGAGLYESVVLAPEPTDEALADALRRVWASVWLQRAYEEREWFRIEHDAVTMAILVQPFVADVVANGVAITRNPYDEGRPGVFINTQVTGASVTGARGGEFPEQFVVYTWAEDLEPELISRSSLTDGAAILSEAEVMALTHLLRRIDDTQTPRYQPRANAMDVEFLLTRERRFVFVQARPYNVLYTAGQQWRSP